MTTTPKSTPGAIAPSGPCPSCGGEWRDCPCGKADPVTGHVRTEVPGTLALAILSVESRTERAAGLHFMAERKERALADVRALIARAETAEDNVAILQQTVTGLIARAETAEADNKRLRELVRQVLPEMACHAVDSDGYRWVRAARAALAETEGWSK